MKSRKRPPGRDVLEIDHHVALPRSWGQTVIFTARRRQIGIESSPGFEKEQGIDGVGRKWDQRGIQRLIERSSTKIWFQMVSTLPGDGGPLTLQHNTYPTSALFDITHPDLW